MLPTFVPIAPGCVHATRLVQSGPASVLVDTAKVENEYLKITGQDHANFLEVPVDDALRITTVASPFPTAGNVTRHRLQG